MMKISTPIEETGFFWLPDEHNKRVPGILRISESGKVTLEITIQSHPASPSALDNPRFTINYAPFKRILGMTESGYVTLENCSIIGSSRNSRSTLAKRIIQGDIAFMGEDYGKDREITFSAVSFSIEGLDEWLDIPVGTTDYDLQGNQIQNISIIYSPPEAIIVQRPSEDLKLSLRFQPTSPSGSAIKEAKITRKAYTYIGLESKELRSLNDFLEVINRLHCFLCFATGKTVSVTSITGYSREVTEKTRRNEKERKILIKIFYEGAPISDNNSKMGHHNMLFTYRDVKDQFDTIINEWLANYKKFKPVFDLFFAVRFKAYLYVEGQFLSLAQSIEALHRMRYDGLKMPKNEFKEKLRHANELTLRQRLEKMFEPFLDIYGKEKVPDLVSEIVEVRNLLTHVGSRTKNIGPIRLHALCGKLDALLQLHFLRMTGMDSAFIAKLAKNTPALREKVTWSEEDYRISFD